MRKLVAAILIGSAMLVAACNTIEGVGRDVESAGDAVADAAKDNK